MSKEDLKLLFDTERQILRRRLKALFPSGSPYRARDAVRPSKARRKTAARPGRAPRPAAAAGAPTQPRTIIRKRHSAKGLLTSLAAHVVILAIVLPIVISEAPITGHDDGPMVVQFITLKEPEKEPAEKSEVTPKETVTEPPEVVQPPVAEPEQPVETPETPPEPPSEPAPVKPADHGLAGQAPATGAGTRSPIGARYTEKSQALIRYGGNTSTEHAVAQGLQWLADHQDRDGSWSPDRYTDHCRGGQRCGGVGFPDYRVGVSSLALLAFLGAGVTDTNQHPLQKHVKSGLTYLLTVQDESGCVGARKGNYMYNHAIAAFCLAEAALLTKRADLRAAAERALAFSAATQQPGGGWDYTAAQTFRNDLSITGWQIMALRAAQQAGVYFSPEMEQKTRSFVRRAVHRNGTSTYADRGIGAGRRGVSIAAVGLLSKLYLGWSPRSPEVERAIERIMRRPPNDTERVDWDHTYQSSYYWYYASLGIFHHGGEAWTAWNTLLQRKVLPLQRDDGHRAGSWDPDPNWIGAAGGRVATTAMLVLTFEVYYRYTPLWKKFGLPATGSTKQ